MIVVAVVLLTLGTIAFFRSFTFDDTKLSEDGRYVSTFFINVAIAITLLEIALRLE